MTVNAIERALLILKAMSQSANGVSVRELARQMAISPAVVQKSLQALVSQGFAEQDPVTQHYHLGGMAIQVGLAGLAKMEIREVARPHLRQLSDATGETALLAVRQGDIAVYVEKALSPLEIRLDVPIGSTRPLNCTAVGKVLLAYTSPEEMRQLAERGAFVRNTPASSTDLETLSREVALIRQRGFSVDREEFTPGTMCFAAPIYNHEARVIATVTVSGPAARVLSREPDIATEVVSTARQISAALGYHE